MNRNDQIASFMTDGLSDLTKIYPKCLEITCLTEFNKH